MNKIDLLLNCGITYKWFAINGELTWDDERPIPTDKELITLNAFNKLRQQRNQLLAQSDWMANSDVTMTEEWRVYRQALRDMPANNPDVALNDAGELINITWPTEPTT